jgi:hypothetical protein
MKRLFTAVFFIAASYVYSIDLAVVSYLPSLFERVAGSDVVWNRFKGREDVEALSIPVEVKFLAASAGPVALSAIAGYTFYVEDDFEGAASHSVSLGLGFSAMREEQEPRLGLIGFYTSVYPLYEFPVATYGKDPVAPWKIALDVGYAGNIGIEGSGVYIYLSVYSRMVGAFADTDGGTKFRLNWPDFGIALGFYISN